MAHGKPFQGGTLRTTHRRDRRRRHRDNRERRDLQAQEERRTHGLDEAKPVLGKKQTRDTTLL
jgi:hypothetical protein